MHIPDGVLIEQTWKAGALAGSLLFVTSVRKTARGLDDKRLLPLAVATSLIFAAQTLSTPGAGNGSSHLIGGLFLALIYGPWPAALAMGLIVLIQALGFGDGGLTALGINYINLGIAAPFAGIAIVGGIRSLRIRKHTVPFELASVFIAAWVSVMIAGILTVLEYQSGGMVSFRQAAADLLPADCVAGLIEGVITTAAFGVYRRFYPALIWSGEKESTSSK